MQLSRLIQSVMHFGAHAGDSNMMRAVFHSSMEECVKQKSSTANYCTWHDFFRVLNNRTISNYGTLTPESTVVNTWINAHLFGPLSWGTPIPRSQLGVPSLWLQAQQCVISVYSSPDKGIALWRKCKQSEIHGGYCWAPPPSRKFTFGGGMPSLFFYIICLWWCCCCIVN